MRKIKTTITAILLSATFCFSAFANEWKLDENGWWYQYDNGSYASGAWKEIGGKWYYFNDGGYMLSNTITPDGYKVGASGEWIKSEEDVKKDEVKSYTFNSKGEWVKDGDIPEGEYVYYPGDQSKTYVVKGSSSPMGNFNYVKLDKNDTVNTGIYVSVTGAENLDISKEGVFLVGKDIKSGTYNLTPTKAVGSRAECIVYTSIPSNKDMSAPQKNMEQDFFVFKTMNNTVTVKDGQYIQVIECTANFTRP